MRRIIRDRPQFPLTIAISELPEGAVLTDGTHTFTASQGATTADITGWDLAQINITPPRNYFGNFTIQVIATATEPKPARKQAFKLP